jgi:phosphoribosylamine---glycine ligase
MKVLVVGSGGREHALVWKLAGSNQVTKVFCAPGNAGTAALATNVAIKDSDIDGLLEFAQKNEIGLTVAGPEAPLVDGIVDRFTEAGLTIFGPSAKAAQLEGSKSFAKRVMIAAGAPTAKYEAFTDFDKAKAYLSEIGAPVVVKADGLAAGKGVILCYSENEALNAVKTVMTEKAFGEAGDVCVIEELLVGEEASFLALTDGETVLPLASSQDHKAVYDGDTGPNTGGMGAYSPAPVVSDEIHDRIMNEVMIPVVKQMKADGTPYKGLLYAGLMIDGDGTPKVLEFNVRFGDPECQPLLFRMDSDLVPLLLACSDGTLAGKTIEWGDPTVCVVLASGGYPGTYEKGKPITGLGEVTGADRFVFHAGTRLGDNGEALTNGGRVLGVTAKGKTIAEAIENAYDSVAKVSFEKIYFRKDIGKKALDRG